MRTSAASLALVWLAVLVTSVAVASAHDFWVEPASYRPTVGQELDLRLRVGEALEGEEFPRSLRHVERFNVVGPAGILAVAGEHMELPAGRFTPTDPGTHWVVYRSHDSTVEVEAEKFGPYLESEGNGRWIADWKQLDPSQAKPVREAFSRCAKALLTVEPVSGGAAATAIDPSAKGSPATAPARFDTVVGLTLELVPLDDPLLGARGVALRFRLLWNGKPLADTQIAAISLADPTQPLKARTDDHGHVAFVLDAPGLWLLKSVVFERALPGEAAMYRSTWSVLTLERPAALAVPAQVVPGKP